MPLEAKQGRKIGIFLKDNIPTDKNSFVEREVYVTLQGSKTGKETKVKLKINAGRRHPAIQSRTGAVTLNENGQIVETFNPNQIPEEIEEIEKIEEIIDKVEELEKEKITPSPAVDDEIEKQLQKLEEVASGEDLSATSAQKKAAKATQTAVQKSQAKAAALSEKLASKGITKKSSQKKTKQKKKASGMVLDV
jgi:hypothetical protein